MPQVIKCSSFEALANLLLDAEIAAKEAAAEEAKQQARLKREIELDLEIERSQWNDYDH